MTKPAEITLRNMKNKLFKQLFIFMLIPLFLYACNSENVSPVPGDDTHNEPEEITLNANDSIDFSMINTITTIDLTKNVSSDGGQNLRLKSVTPIDDNNDCKIINIHGLKYDVMGSDYQVCKFKYVVESSFNNDSRLAEAVSQVVVSDSDEETLALAPLSFTMKSSNNDFISTLNVDLNLTLPDNFKLVEGSIVIDNGSDDLGKIDIEKNIIEYSAPIDFLGVSILYYTVVNNLNIADIRAGIIYISINPKGTNTAPDVISVTTLPDDSLTAHPSGLFNIDLSSLVSDVDEDRLQLIATYTNGLGNAVNLDTLSFDYAPYDTGMQYITFVITDHHGGYSIGTLNFYISTYPSIQYNGLTYTGPKTMSEVTGTFSNTYVEDGTSGIPGVYPTFDLGLAADYCITKGMALPNSEQLKDLYTNALDGYPVYSSKYKWHSGMEFIATDGSVSLGTGDSTNTKLGYYTCINVQGEADDYGFLNPFFTAKFDIAVSLYAAMNLDGIQYFYPNNAFDLSSTIIDTDPPNQEASVDVEIFQNIIKITQKENMPSVYHVTLKVTDSGIMKEGMDSTLVMVGLNQCSDEMSVADMQLIGCIPIMNEENSGRKYTGALPKNVIDTMLNGTGIEPPELLKTTDTSPAYSYYDFIEMKDTYTVEELKSYINEYGQAYCDVLNSNEISGRGNWTVWRKGSTVIDSTYKVPIVGTIANRLTTWMSESTGLNLMDVGQGIWIDDDGAVKQLNQFNDDNALVYQGGVPYEEHWAWQFLSCYSPEDG